MKKLTKKIPLIISMIALSAFIPFSLGASESGHATESHKQSEAQKTHWLTIKTKKRHNSGCRYFKKSNGRMCGPNEGIACKVCGG